MPIIRQGSITSETGSNYPAPHNDGLGDYEAWPLSDAGGLTQFGAFVEKLYPGAVSSHRHWHDNEDEFVYLLEGEVVLVDDDGEHAMSPGDAATFRAGVANGHQLRNRSDRPAMYVVVGTRLPEDRCHYSDIDMLLTRTADSRRFTRRDGSPLPGADDAG